MSACGSRVFALAALLTLASPAGAAGPSSITCNGVEMPVKSGVAVWDAKSSSLKLFLMPFEPTAAEVELLQKDDTLWLDKRPRVDAKKWPTWNPHAYLLLSWSWAPEAVNDLGRLSQCAVFQHDITRNAVNSFVNCKEGVLNGTLKGDLKDGETVTLSAKGQGKQMDYTISWAFSVTTKVVPQR